jgi:protein involved in polysaccharide export with SLBB domain
MMAGLKNHPARWSLIALSGLVALAGCADHRVGIAELQQIERSAQSVAPEQNAEQMAATAAMLDRQLGPYRVGVGDLLTISMMGLNETTSFEPRPVRVNRNGEIHLPQVGLVQVGGLELEDAETAVTAAYVPNVYKDSVAHVGLIEANTTKVVVTGAVPLPSMIALPNTERNMLHAINLAGGLTPMASGKVTLRRLRNPTQEVTLNLSDPLELRAALSLDPLTNGDMINVAAATPNTVFVGGLVNGPRPQIYPDGVQMSVLQILAGAGGLRDDLTPREATLIRRMENGSDVHVKLNLDKIKRGEDPNILLAAGDILWVPHTVETRIQEFINNNIFVRAGISYSASGDEDYIHGDSFRFGNSLEDSFDPFGFLTRSSAIRSLGTSFAP